MPKSSLYGSKIHLYLYKIGQKIVRRSDKGDSLVDGQIQLISLIYEIVA